MGTERIYSLTKVMSEKLGSINLNDKSDTMDDCDEVLDEKDDFTKAFMAGGSQIEASKMRRFHYTDKSELHDQSLISKESCDFQVDEEESNEQRENKIYINQSQYQVSNKPFNFGNSSRI